jgi:hypothetical protein
MDSQAACIQYINNQKQKWQYISGLAVTASQFLVFLILLPRLRKTNWQSPQTPRKCALAAIGGVSRKYPHQNL